MTLRRFQQAADFYQMVGGYLLNREAEHNLMLGLCAGLMSTSPSYSEIPYLAAVTEGDNVLAAALRTPPHNIVLARAQDLEALAAIAQDAEIIDDGLPGVVGPVPEVRAFAESWTALTDRETHEVRNLRIYQLERVIPAAPVPGGMRDATPDDRRVLMEWTGAFRCEALGESYPDNVSRTVDRHLAEGGYVLWDHNGPVSMSAFGGGTRNGIRINAVYTPPKERCQGYASALVAALSQRLLDSGRRFCFLFTDLANPTSNHIYQAIGYEPVSDVLELEFRG